MKILIIGATGTIGRAVADELSGRHDVIRVGHSSGDLRADITDPASLEQLFSNVGPVDAVVSAAGVMYVGPLEKMTEDEMKLGVMDKLMGQIRVARLALPALADGGSITLSSGLASRIYRPGFSVLAAVNAGLEAFGKATALDLPRGIRINIVSPGGVTETMKALGWDSSIGTPAAEVALAYAGLVEGKETGTVVDVGRV